MGDDTKLSQKIRRLFSSEDTEENATEIILSMINEGQKLGIFGGSEAEMIRHIFAYGKKDAKDIMTHRKNIVALDGEETLENALTFILEQNNSRLPVYENDIDTIIGILHLRDAMKCYFDERLRNVPIKNLVQFIRPVKFIPETRSIDRLFKQMQRDQIHMVIVIDEYGQTSGLVAMEDIIEEIVGNILDEYDVEEEFIIKQTDGTYLIQGMASLTELESLLQISFETEDCETLNGFLVIRLDHIPCEGEACEINYRFQVQHVENNTIQSVKVEKIEEEC
ncbi:MAG: hemolysin family protein [Lachnospiraceae bacterium]